MPSALIQVVDPSLRGGWANILLLEGLTFRARAAGATRRRFFADVKVTNTIRLARRAQAREILTERWFWRAVDAAEAGAE